MYAKQIIGVLCLSVLLTLPATLALAALQDSTVQAIFENNSGASRNDLHITFNQNVAAVSGNYLPFTSANGVGTTTIDFSGGTVIPDQAVGCILFKSTSPDPQIVSASWTPGNICLAPRDVRGCNFDLWAFNGPDYYSDLNPSIGSLDPQNGSWLSPPWHPACLPLPNFALNNGNEIAFGKGNRTIVTNIKQLTLTVTYTAPNCNCLELNGLGTGWVFGKAGPGRDVNVSYAMDPDANCVMIITITYDPQPEWEWILLTAKCNGVQITGVNIVTQCSPKGPGGGRVPSLTQWGMLALGVLILAAGAMVIIQRRRIAVGA